VRAPARIKEAAGGSFVAPCRGRLVLVFDNSYSWVKSKTVMYECVEIAPDAPDTVGAVKDAATSQGSPTSASEKTDNPAAVVGSTSE